jgi:hypothetical protein
VTEASARIRLLLAETIPAQESLVDGNCGLRAFSEINGAIGLSGKRKIA